jgi:CRP/FNR family transcriptional regulator, cyclic AMP receptor protein
VIILKICFFNEKGSDSKMMADKQSLVLLPEKLKNTLNELAVSHKMAKDSMLYQDGDLADKLYIIRSGKAKIFKITPEGKELTLEICQEGDIAGELILFNSDATYITNAIMIIQGEIGVIDKVRLEEKIYKDGELAVDLMRWFGLIYRKNQSKFRDLMLNGKQGALYSTLIRMVNTYGKKKDDGGILIDLFMTNQDLANFIGVARESVNRMLNDLQSKGIIKMDHGYITVLDMNYLRVENDCDDCPDEICRM